MWVGDRKGERYIVPDRELIRFKLRGGRILQRAPEGTPHTDQTVAVPPPSSEGGASGWGEPDAPSSSSRRRRRKDA